MRKSVRELLKIGAMAIAGKTFLLKAVFCLPIGTEAYQSRSGSNIIVRKDLLAVVY
jgi:hypothetical protein